MRQPSGGNQRNWWKVTHVLQICLLIALFVWLLYQVKRSHDKKMAVERRNFNISDRTEQSLPEFLKLGRKDPRQSIVEVAVDNLHPSGEEEGNEEAEEAAERGSRQEANGEEGGRGAGDDETDENDLASAGEDGEVGDEFAEEEEKEGQLGDLGSSGHRHHEGADGNSHASMEEDYTASDASSSSAVIRDAQELSQGDGNIGTGNFDEEQMRPEGEGLGNDGSTNVTRTGSVSTEGEPQDVPTDGDNQLLHTTSLDDAAAVMEAEDGSVRNSTVLLEFGHVTEGLNEQMEQQDSSSFVEPRDQVEQRNNPVEDASDEQMEARHEGDKGTIDLGSAWEQIAVNETGDLTEGNPSSENVLFGETEKYDTNGSWDESQTASSVADGSGDAVQGEPSDPSGDAAAITGEEREILAHLSTLPHTHVESRTVQDVAAE